MEVVCEQGAKRGGHTCYRETISKRGKEKIREETPDLIGEKRQEEMETRGERRRKEEEKHYI